MNLNKSLNNQNNSGKTSKIDLIYFENNKNLYSDISE